jgi:hypothetical protein
MPTPKKDSQSGKYIKELRQRAKESHVYREYQMTGLTIAETLGDEKHKSLYIKLAKENDGGKLLRLAKDVADRKGVKNKGAYFMYCLAHPDPDQKNDKRNIAHKR